MRSVRIVLLLMLLAAPAYAVERTWTISTGSYAMAAELVEVRGDIAYLRTGDRVEHIPLARLSAADMQYITSQSPEIIFPGPADEADTAADLPLPGNEFNALPPGGPVINDAAPAVKRTMQKPVIDSPARQPNPTRATSQYRQAEEMLPVPSSSSQPANRLTRIDPRTLNNSNVRRPTSAQRQYQNTSADRNRSRNDERSGLFGWRSRRQGN